MKITAHSCLERMLFEATIQARDAMNWYAKVADEFFNHDGNADKFRQVKRHRDAAIQRLADLETAKRVIEEIEKKGIEI